MRVVTYNVLATRYIRRDYYPRVEQRFLDPAWRHPALVDAVGALGADHDLICLQEVEREVFEAIEARLAPHFVGALAMKGRSKPDGAALFARRETLELETPEPLYYADNSGHLAQIAIVRAVADQRALAVANTHLRWDPPRTARADKLGVAQIEQLLDTREQRAPGCAAWLVCGDLNAAPGSDVVTTLEQRGLHCVHAGSGAATCNANARLQLIDHLFVSAALDATPIMPPAIEAETPLPSGEQPSDHLPLSAELHFASD
ncbi:MAG: endonuclease/exonuclease/phosphatase family protein [Myxococcales bacterium]|nr:endonuclease/exonuclease/phosphatase family protein [Myxococcales bacterium]